MGTTTQFMVCSGNWVEIKNFPVMMYKFSLGCVFIICNVTSILAIGISIDISMVSAWSGVSDVAKLGPARAQSMYECRLLQTIVRLLFIVYSCIKQIQTEL